MCETRVCEHVRALKAHLTSCGLVIWGEFTEDPGGWVNVTCQACNRTYEVSLQPPEEDDEDER
jgi:hypothetical protein